MNDSLPTGEPRASADRCVFRKDGEYWTIVYAGRAIRVKDAKGMHCLAELLRHPGREFYATDLVTIGGQPLADERAASAETAEAADLGTAGEALDARAKAEYRRRLEDLREELAEAERFNDAGRAAAAREEMEAIGTQLAAGVGLGGRDRPTASHAERARVAVTQRLKAATAKIRDHHPALGRHLTATVKTGAFCSYNPDPTKPISWQETETSPTSAAAPRTAERRLAAILSADVKAYSRLMADDEVATIRTLTSYRAIMARLIEQHGGRVVDSPGDNLLAELGSAVDAVRAAVAIQAALQTENAKLPEHRRMEFRIGINAGDVMVENGKIYGDTVNVAARLESLADPGGICVSGAVHDHVRNKLDLEYQALGVQAMKNIAEPVRVFRVRSGSRAWAIPAKQVTSRRRVLFLLASLLIVAAALTLLQSSRALFESSPRLVTPADRPSIAVLPFVNLSEDPEQQYFSDGMTQDLIADLSKISGLFVIATNSVLSYRTRPVKLSEVSRDLGVRYVVDGSVRKAGDRVRIAAELLDASTGHSVWSDRYDRELKDVFSVQDEIIGQITTDLNVEVQEAEFDRVRRIPTANLTAYDWYLRGMDRLRRTGPPVLTANPWDPEARRMFERAVELDPKFARAYAALGFMALSDMFLPSEEKAIDQLQRAVELADKALSADDSSAMAHILSANTSYAYALLFWGRTRTGNASSAKGGMQRSVAEIQQAIAMDPSNADVRIAAALLLTFARDLVPEEVDPKQPLGEVEEAIRLNPRHPPWYLTVLGLAYTSVGRYREAIDAHRSALLGNPDLLYSHAELAELYRAFGREDEAKVEEREAKRLFPSYPGAGSLVLETSPEMPSAADPSAERFRVR